MAATSKPLNKRRIQGERSREEILDVASRMMSVRGYDGTSIAAIAHESGLPNSSIYWHFTSKSGILAAVMERGAERFFVDVAPGAREPDAAPIENLRRGLRHTSTAIVGHPEFLRLYILLQLSNQDERILPIVERVRARGRENLHALIAHAYAERGPDVADAVAEATVDFALSTFDGAFLALQVGAPTTHERLMDQLADALAGLGDAELARRQG